MNYAVVNMPKSKSLAFNIVERIDEIMFKQKFRWTCSVSPDFSEGEVNFPS